MDSNLCVSTLELGTGYGFYQKYLVSDQWRGSLDKNLDFLSQNITMASEESGLLLSPTTPSSPRGPYHGIEASADDEEGIFSRHISSSDGRYSYCTKPLLIILATSSIVIGISTCILVGFAPQKSFHSGVLSTTTNLYLLGKSNKKKKDEKNECERDTSYSKHTLKSAYDLPYAALFRKYS